MSERALKMLSDLGVEFITIHGRTRSQMYDGEANWELIEQAAELNKVPIIGNGDLVLPDQIKAEMGDDQLQCANDRKSSSQESFSFSAVPRSIV